MTFKYKVCPLWGSHSCTVTGRNQPSPAVHGCTTDRRLRAGRAAVLGRHRAWRRPRPLDRLPYPVLRRGSRRKKRHKPDPATNNTFHASGGSLTHASEGKARRVLTNIPTPGDLSASQGVMWLKITEGCLAVVGDWDSAALLRERSGGQRAEAHAAESGHRAPTVASSTVQHRFRHHCRHAS